MVTAGYICNRCGLNCHDVQVRDRAAGEDVVNYVHHVGRICGENHRIRSPLCAADKLDLKVPISDKGIGLPGRELTEEEHEGLRRQLREGNP
jgi:hypothetical protein